MNTFDYDELKNSRLSKTVLNPYLDRSRRRRPFKVIKLNVFKLTNFSTNHRNRSIHLSKTSSHLKPNSRSRNLNFNDLTTYLKVNYSKRRPRVRRKHRSTQTRQLNEPILHDNNRVLELPSAESTVYVNLSNGFSSYKREDILEDKSRVLKFSETSEIPRSPTELRCHAITRVSNIDFRPDLGDRFQRANQTAKSYLSIFSGHIGAGTFEIEIERNLRLFHEVKIDKNVFAKLKVGF